MRSMIRNIIWCGHGNTESGSCTAIPEQERKGLLRRSVYITILRYIPLISQKTVSTSLCPFPYTIAEMVGMLDNASANIIFK